MSYSKIFIDNDLTISNHKTSVIAEIGINHNGDPSLAKEMIVSAWQNGADLIKLQSFKTESFISSDLDCFDSVKSLELNFDIQKDLFLFAKKKGIRIFTTPFDIETINFLDEFDLPLYKIASMDLNNYQLIKEVAKRGKPIILSTGMANENEIEEALNVARSTGNKKIILLHCVSDYPTANKDFNLSYMLKLKERFNVMVGISDHTIGMNALYLSVGARASVVEKHFSIGKSKDDKYAGPDHLVSMQPEDLKSFIEYCKASEELMGDGIRKLTENEQNGREIFRRGLYASCDILKDEVISRDNVIAKRPVKGLSVSMLDDILGKKVKKELKKGSFITNDSLFTV